MMKGTKEEKKGRKGGGEKRRETFVIIYYEPGDIKYFHIHYLILIHLIVVWWAEHLSKEGYKIVEEVHF